MMFRMRARDLSPAEEVVWQAFSTGNVVDFGSLGETRESARQVRSEVLAALISGSAQPDVATGTVRLRGAVLKGTIQLLAAQSKYALFLEACSIEGGVELKGLTTSTLSMRHCQISFIDLESTKINGQLDLTGTKLTSATPFALRADGLSITGNVDCTDLRAHGQVRFDRAAVEGDLVLNGAFISTEAGPALWGDRLTVTHNMYCGTGTERRPFRAVGGIRLIWGNIGAQLVLRGAQLDAARHAAVDGHGLNVTGDMICDNQFQSSGAIHLDLARVGGLLSFDGAELTNDGAVALFAAGLV